MPLPRNDLLNVLFSSTALAELPFDLEVVVSPFFKYCYCFGATNRPGPPKQLPARHLVVGTGRVRRPGNVNGHPPSAALKRNE